MIYNDPKFNFSEEKVRDYYKKYKSIELMAKELGCSYYIAQKNLDKFGIDHKPHKIHTLDEDFFNKLAEPEYTDKVLYWLGWMASDGCVNKNNISLNLKEQDRIILENFRKDLNSTAPIDRIECKNSERNSKWKNSFNCCLRMCSMKLIETLKQFDIGPRKSLTMKFPEILINHPKIHIFLRGYCDGDGCVGVYKNPQFSLCGTEEFLKTFNNIITEKCGLSTYKIKKHCGIYVIAFSGKGMFTKFVNWLYSDVRDNSENNLYLPRKLEIVKPYFYKPEELII